MRVLRNVDAPGLIGSVGTVLGRAGINISDMRVGRQSREGDEAAMVITVDTKVPPDVREELRGVEGIREGYWVVV